MENVANDMKYYLDQAGNLLEQLGKTHPAFLQAYMNFSQESKKAGVLSAKIKELICVAIGVIGHQPLVIAVHTNKAIAAGASREEIMEAGFVAASMGGGPSLADIRYVIDACDQFGAK